MSSVYLAQFLILVLLAGLSVLGKWAYPWLQEYRVAYWIKLAVKVAEDDFKLPKSGEDKRAFVEKFLRAKFKIPEADLKILINGTVAIMKKEGLI